MKTAIRILASAGLVCLAVGAAAAAPGPRADVFTKRTLAAPPDYAGSYYRPTARWAADGWQKAADFGGLRPGESRPQLSFAGSAAGPKAADASRRLPSGAWSSFGALQKDATGLAKYARSLSGGPATGYRAGRIHGLAAPRLAASSKERSFTIAVRRSAAASLEKLFESWSR